MDREQRPQKAEDIEQEIHDNLVSRGVDCSKIVISVPDRCIESWFAPFLDEKCSLQRSVANSIVEGQNAKSEVKKIFKNNGRKYVEVIDGVNMLKLIVPDDVVKVNKSFSRFIQKIHDGCWWNGKGC
ncbi:hypothetical protein M2281_001588 [Mesorhizobium soli]|uniref:hypothetical protein n=1 Tax=Pseudaminobacter soli (ex Li et al. 2025) TaxID=1295366 RepID=UPI00247616D9|nr:hypothetical protein [Mesorhizobium soli]MDH6231016.1 hypothetical protein [Mesorhizobium soli]